MITLTGLKENVFKFHLLYLNVYKIYVELNLNVFQLLQII